MANRQITADTPDPLVLDMYKHLAEQSQHFNGIESTYRTLASTWLLASFGGMGFILKDLDQYKGQQALFIAAVADGLDGLPPTVGRSLRRATADGDAPCVVAASR